MNHQMAASRSRQEPGEEDDTQGQGQKDQLHLLLRELPFGPQNIARRAADQRHD